MGIEMVLIIVGVVLKWALNPGVVNHQQTIGSWCVGIGCTILVLEILFFLLVSWGVLSSTKPRRRL